MREYEAALGHINESRPAEAMALLQALLAEPALQPVKGVWHSIAGSTAPTRRVLLF